jgi:DNA polymerase elongation subunit (family B)
MVNHRNKALYPAIMIEYGFLSRNVTNPNRYREIRDTRLKLKAKKDPMQLPYKIVLNSAYGSFKDKYNPLYDPRMANNICVAGQLLLLDLAEKIEKYGKLI